MDLSKLSLAPRKRSRVVDPLQIFNSTTLRGSVQNVYGPQAEALNQWQARRQDADIAIEMNTGGGKTLVGLLVAQSLTNEAGGKVLYVCPNNQLIEQTVKRAEEIGLLVATRMKGHWGNRDVFDEGRGFCITNYASLFNGKSTFRDIDFTGIVFDDAHVAEGTIRSCYTLRLENSHAAFTKIMNLYRPHFVQSSLSSRHQEILDNKPGAKLFVPTFVTWKYAEELRRCLLEHDVDKDDTTLFVWEHVKDSLGACVVMLSGTGIEISPVCIPLQRLKFMLPPVRRVYLTATLPSPTGFLRTFGARPCATISPQGKLGEAQRLFLFIKGQSDDEQKRLALQVTAKHKACIISPSTTKAREWCPPAELFGPTDGHARIEQFSQAKGADKLVLVSRYDGIDLPGDACRVLILDRLPKGESLFEKFIDESLQVEPLRASRTAIRVVQAIGRIFRSNTDHGAVLIVGGELQSWISTPRNQAFLPKLLQQQIQLGLELRQKIEKGDATYEQLLLAILSGDKGWDSLYQNYINEFETAAIPAPPTWLMDVTVKEQVAFQQIWDGNFAGAATSFEALVEQTKRHDARLSAWYQHWAGYAFLRHGIKEAAFRNYSEAANERAELGRPKMDTTGLFHTGEVISPGPQSKRIAGLYAKKKTKFSEIISGIISGLKYGPDTRIAEQAMCDLGSLLGFDASRPDRKVDTGPDVIWVASGDLAGVGLEAKTNKLPDAEYTKDDIGQCHDHAQWITDHYPGKRFANAIVGRKLSVSPQANPAPDLQIIELEGLIDLANRLAEMYQCVISEDQGGDTAPLIEKWLRHFGLKWPQCLAALPSTLAVDLRTVDDGNQP